MASKLANISECTGCMACVDACPTKAITASLKKDGHLYPHLSISKCIDCNMCSSVCPIVSNFEYVDYSLDVDAYSAWSKNAVLRKNSSSGGVFSVIAENILNEGGYVVGAMLSNLEVKYKIISSIEDLSMLQGSKYQHGDWSGVYKQTYKLLKNKKTVLFCGLPCQVAGLLSFVSKKPHNGLLYTIDLICGGIPSILPLKAFSENEENKVKSITSFRDKENGWKSSNYRYSLKIKNPENLICDYGEYNIVTGSFCSQLTNRSSCANCHFSCASRLSDLTIGDYWGINEFKEQHNDGVSAVIVHTSKGEKLMSNSNITRNRALLEDIAKFNSRLLDGKSIFIKYHLARKFYPTAFRFLPYKTLKKLYYASNSKYLIPYKGVLFILNKLDSYFRKYRVEKKYNIKCK